jgi:hypothetical protein
MLLRSCVTTRSKQEGWGKRWAGSDL